MAPHRFRGQTRVLTAVTGTAERLDPTSRLRRRAPGWLGPDTLGTILVLGGAGLAIVTQVRANPFDPMTGHVTFLGHALAAVMLLAGVAVASDGALSPWPARRRSAVAGSLTVGDLALRAVEARTLTRARPIRMQVLGASAILGAATFLLCGGNRFTLLNVTVWALSVATFLVATWQRGEPGPGTGYRSRLARLSDLPGALGLVTGRRSDGAPGLGRLAIPWSLVVACVLCVAGTAVLFWRIGDIPREMTSDHAEKLLDAQDVLDGTYRIFFLRNTGREALQFYLIAAMAPLAGVTYLTMKLGTSLVAAFTLPFTYALGRTMGGIPVGLAALAFEVCMRWLLQVARVGLRFPFPPAFASAIAYLTMRAIRDRKRNDFLLLGLVIGVAQHTYTALRLFPIGVAACLSVAYLLDRRATDREEPARRLLVDSALMTSVAFLVFMPLARFAVEDPQAFLFRGMSRLASDRIDEVPANAFVTLATNFREALLFFNWTGDTVWVNSIPRLPVLDPVSGGLLVVGVAWCAYRLAVHHEARYGYLAILAVTGMLPSVLSIAYPGENPSTVRMGGVIPIVAVVIALGLIVPARRLGKWLGIDEDPSARMRNATSVLVVATFACGLVAWAWSLNARTYFVDYPRQHALSSQHASRFGDAVRAFVAMGGQREDVYIFPGAHWVDWRLVAIEGGDVLWQPIIETVAAVLAHDGSPRRRLYLIHPEDHALISQLSRWYPTGTVLAPGFPETGGMPLFVSIDVPGGSVARQS